MSRPHKRPARPLTILQVNVGRGATPHEIALSLANDSSIDIILLQEPYIFTDRSRRISKAHPAYESFTPSDDWTIRPRVISYVRKGAGLQIAQLRPATTRDIIFLEIQTRNSLPVVVINAYNAPLAPRAPETQSGFLKASHIIFLGPPSLRATLTFYTQDGTQLSLARPLLDNLSQTG